MLDDGQPVLLLDVTNIAAQYGLVSDVRNRVLKGGEETDKVQAKQVTRGMLFTDFSGRNCAIRLELVQRIETAPASAIDRSGTSPRAVIEGAILPLIGLPDGPLPAEKVRLLRLTDGSSQLLYAVREVDDAAELDGVFKPVADDRAIEAVTLVDGRAVTVINGHELFARHGEIPETAARPVCRIPASDWARTILAPLVASAGYEVTEDENGQEDVAIWFDDAFEAASALDVEIRGPVIRLRDAPGATEDSGTVYRYDRDALIAALGGARSAVKMAGGAG